MAKCLETLINYLLDNTNDNNNNNIQKMIYFLFLFAGTNNHNNLLDQTFNRFESDYSQLVNSDCDFERFVWHSYH